MSIHGWPPEKVAALLQGPSLSREAAALATGVRMSLLLSPPSVPVSAPALPSTASPPPVLYANAASVAPQQVVPSTTPAAAMGPRPVLYASNASAASQQPALSTATDAPPSPAVNGAAAPPVSAPPMQSPAPLSPAKSASPQVRTFNAARVPVTLRLPKVRVLAFLKCASTAQVLAIQQLRAEIEELPLNYLRMA